ncbi:MAG: GNAT family N-acetyltransferase [Qingshengfaniella sp.]
MEAPLTGWHAPGALGPARLVGRFVRVEPLVPAHAEALFAAFAGHDALWNYMGGGPFDRAAWDDWVTWAAAQRDPLFHTILTPDAGPVGVAAWLRITPAHGVAEVGHLVFAPVLQRTPAATEAMSLMARHAFDAGYRRYEWKCNAANLASRRAATRLGFSFEGVFRQHMVVKGRNRDTAWFAMTDGDWPGIAAAHDRWLAPDNFDAAGRQNHSLADLTAPLLRQPDPGAAG